MSNQTAKRGLSVKDLVTIGIFTALMLVFSMVGGIFFAPNPVLTFYMPVGSAILCGPIYLLLIAKVKKRFAITIVGALIGIIWFVTGMHWAFALGTILMGIVADLAAGIGGYASRKINAISYMLYSLGGTGSYLVFFADPDGWAKTMLGNGTEQGYIDTMQATGNSAILAVMLIGTLAAALISAAVGSKMLKKQFEKLFYLEDIPDIPDEWIASFHDLHITSVYDYLSADEEKIKEMQDICPGFSITEMEKILNIKPPITRKKLCSMRFPLIETEISTRAFNALRRSGINTLGQLTQLTESDLKKVRNLGPKCCEEIKELLEKYNLQLLEK